MQTANDDILNTYTIANKAKFDELILDPEADLLHCCISSGGFLNLYPGFKVVETKSCGTGFNQELILTLKPDDGYIHELVCPHCAAAISSSSAVKNGLSPITLRDSPIGPCKVSCLIMQQCYNCPVCRAKFFNSPSFKHHCHNITFRMYSLILKELQSPIALNEIAKRLGVNINIISAIDKAQLAYFFDVPSLKDVRCISIDEHSIQKGHVYVTVVYDALTRQLLFVCKGKRKSDIKPFFDRLKKEGAADKIEAASCDCASGFISMLEENLPNAKVIIDEFHVLKMFSAAIEIVRNNERRRMLTIADMLNYKFSESMSKEWRQKKIGECRTKLLTLCMTNDELDKILAEKTNKAEIYRTQAAALVRTRWAISLGMRALQEKKPQDIIEAIKSNDLLKELAILGDLLRDFWHSGFSPKKTERYILAWIETARNLNKGALNKFCSFLEKLIRHIIYACSTGISNSPVEGLNSEAKAYQRVIRGVKDLEHYILKLHSFFREPRERKVKPTYVRKNGVLFPSLRQG